MTNIQPSVTAINAFNDNYIWAISQEDSDNVALVDPGDADVCIAYIEEHNLVLTDILITHHHNDHVGGIKKLLSYASTCSSMVTVYGPANENIANIDISLTENDSVNLTAIDCQFTVIDLPGHTKGHIAFYNDTMLFCGDTLFSAGCGRVFEGTPEQMHQSLTKLANLPDKTRVYCAHEYTQANIAFALAVEPNNVELQNYAKIVEKRRQSNQATIPTSIGLERKVNPFLRCSISSIQDAAKNHSDFEAASDSDIFKIVRAWKDKF